MFRKYLIALTLLILFASSSVGNGETYEEIMGIGPFKIRSMGLTYFEHDDKGFVNDYRLFGIVKEAIESTWDARRDKIKILNGLTFNSDKSTTGELESLEFDIGILIQTKKRLGKLLYIFTMDCETAGLKTTSTQFDLIGKTRFYSEMKRLTIAFAKGCPKPHP
tara:strand:+ start:93 stop:584 length:492 start_codon:yes stop_codon:yes gene_type:complete